MRELFDFSKEKDFYDLFLNCFAEISLVNSNVYHEIWIYDQRPL
jgi:hypothetical protein